MEYEWLITSFVLRFHFYEGYYEHNLNMEGEETDNDDYDNLWLYYADPTYFPF
jgi:hypothetical protein